jgi:ubiquitin related modifier 1
MSSSSTLNLKIEFGGGTELLFGNVRSHKITIPATAPPTAPTTPGSSKPERPADVTFLIQWLKDNLLKERSELFVDANGKGVCVRHFVWKTNDTDRRGDRRPGILVLINDTDWELEGEEDYVLQPGDEVVFISTLHGG